MKNNFDFIRLAYALMVIITHSYALLDIPETRDLLGWLSNGQMVLSYWAVRGFFCLSGYLIIQSLLRSNSLLSYVMKRVLRIFPAFLFLLLLTFCTTAYYYTDKNLAFSNKSVWRYLFENLTLRINYKIDHIFEKNNMSTINGSLWTIPYEFYFYLFITPLFFIKKRNIHISTIILSISLLFAIDFIVPKNQFGSIPIIWLSTNYCVSLGIYFLMGALLSFIKEWLIKNANTLALVSIALTVMSFYFETIYISKYFLIPLLTISFGYVHIPFLNNIGKHGDFSYGIYLFSFPVSQIILSFYPKISASSLSITTIVFVFPIAFISWHLIEKKAIQLKYKILKKV